MEPKGNFIAVGVFLVAAVTAIGCVAVWLMTGGVNRHDRETIVIIYEGDASGLKKGSAVTFNGVRVGEVVKLGLIEKEPSSVSIVASVDERTPIKVDSQISLSHHGFTGITNVSLSGGTKESASLFVLGGKRELRVQDTTTRDLMEGARKIIGRTDESIARISSLLQNNEQTVALIMQNIEVFTRSMAGSYATVGRILDNVEEVISVFDADEVQSILGDAQSISSELSRTSDGLNKIITTISDLSERTDRGMMALVSLIEEVLKVSKTIDVDRISPVFNKTMDAMESLAERTAELNEMIEDMQSITRVVNSFVSGVGADEKDIRTSVVKVRQTIENLESLSSHISTLIHDADTGIDKNQAGLLFAELNELLKSSSETAKKFHDLANTIDVRVKGISDDVHGVSLTSNKALHAIKQLAEDISANPQFLLFGGNRSSVTEYSTKRRN